MKNKNNQKQQLNKNQTTVNTRNIGKNVNATVQLNNKTNANNKGVSDQSSKLQPQVKSQQSKPTS